MNAQNLRAAAYGGLIYTTGREKGIPIGELKEDNGHRILEVRDHKRVDYILVDELMSLLVDYQNSGVSEST